jgi:hypothetical protein
MGTPREASPAKYFVGLLSSAADFLTAVEPDLEALLGPVQDRSEIFPWTASRFYEAEMGAGLLRRFVVFAPLFSPEMLADIKLGTQNIEDRYRDLRGRRRINCDPGYLEAGKVVLASTKNASHRIYLRDGIFAEVTLEYFNGAFHGSRHTYRDYLWPETLDFLGRCRSAYLKQLRALRCLPGATG